MMAGRSCRIRLGAWIFTVGVTAGISSGSTIYVNAAATGANNGTGWTDAFTSLQSALASAGPGSEIWVASGTYKPTTGADRTISFALKNAVGVYGGFAGTETLRSQRNPPANPTILSGDIGVAGDASDNSYHVVTSDGTVGPAGILDGFTITGGNANVGGSNRDRGGGMWLRGSPTVSGCVFIANSASERGGGIRVSSASPTIDRCVFASNSAGHGGGGIGTTSGSTFTVSNSIFRNNSAGSGGAGLDTGSNDTVVNCVFQNNSGSGARFTSSGHVINSTFTGNSSFGVVFSEGGSVVNSILWGDAIGEVSTGSGTVTVSYSDVGGSGSAGPGNRSADPLFVNPAANDLRLGAGSPAVDAGNNASVPAAITTDAAGLPRFFDDPAVLDTGAGAPPIVDMGAYERVPLSVTAPSPSPQNICVGSAAGFSVTAAGAGPFTYQWRKGGVNLSDGGSISGATTASLSINPAVTGDTGSYDVVVTDSLERAVTSPTGILTVNAVPAAPIAGNNGPICAGQALHLTASPVTGGTYSWTGPNGFTSPQQNPSIPSATTAASGIYSVAVTVAGCTSAAATTNVTVNAGPAAPLAGNNGPVCGGQTLQLSASTVAGAAYSWTGPNGFTSSQQNPSIPLATTAASGSYSVTVTVSGCTSIAAATNVSVEACSARPTALSVGSGSSAVLEPGQSVVVAPSWQNATGFPFPLTGAATSFGGPTGATYTLLDSLADYGTVPAGATANCASATGNCYSVSVSNPATRPAFHWDASLAESVSSGDTKTWAIHIGSSFADVPVGNPFYRFIETMLHDGITVGCGSGNYCPANLVTRAQMSVFLLRSKEGAAYSPPPCTTPVFADVPCSSPFAPWVDELAARAITGGCAFGQYCPDNPVTRAQMSVFLLRTSDGPSYTPPACTTPVFADVPCSNPFAPWIDQLAARGITAGCGGGNYCPASSVTRGQMSVFLTRAFGLTLYGP